MGRTVHLLGCLSIDLSLRLSDDHGTGGRSDYSLLLGLRDGDVGGGLGGGGSLADLLGLDDIGAVGDAASLGDGWDGSPLTSSGLSIVVRGLLSRNVDTGLLLGVGDEHEGSVGRGRGGGGGSECG